MFFRILILTILLLSTSGVLRAADYQVRIRQINPDSWTYNSVCKDGQEFCHVFMGIVPQNGTYPVNDLELDVGMTVKDGVMLFQFKSRQDYFSLADHQRVFSMPLDASETQAVKIYVPNPMAKDDPANNGLYQLPVMRPAPEMLAELEITIQEQ